MNHRRANPKSSVIAAAVSLALLGIFLVSRPARAFPEPALVPSQWQLDIEIGDPTLIRVQLPLEDHARLYWYLPYTVTNNSGADRLFVPEVTIFTSQGHVLRANRAVPPIVYDTVDGMLRNRLLESPVTVVGNILQGEDFAKDSVILWEAPAADVKWFRLFIAGLSGETAQITDPLTRKPVLLRKTLMAEYQTPGDIRHTAQKPVLDVGKQWIMR